MSKLSKSIGGLALVLLFAAAPALADVPTQMNVQGRLTGSSGAPAPAGFKLFTFKIFDQESGGVEIWPGGPGETHTIATNTNGLWSAAVGKLIPLTEAVFQSPTRWLEFTVDDGVNPPETLPRVEMRTNPYTYRAATSQNADSLGGATYPDLVGLFVDTRGDTMSGPLGNTWTQKDSGTSIIVENTNDSWVPVMNDGSGTWGISAEVSGDNSLWNVGVAASAQGNDNQNDANYGVIAYADGSGSTNIAFRGFTGMSGTSNYSGYFSEGDFLVTNPQSAGSDGVMLPDNAISATEILDEPGLAAVQAIVGYDFTDVSPAGMVDLLTVTITTPADGYISLQGFAYIWVSGAASTNGVIQVQIDEDAGGGLADPVWRVAGEYVRAGSSNTFHMTPLDRVYFKTAGTYTFRIEGQRNSISTGTEVHVFNASLTATYYPTSYGSVVTTVAGADAGRFEGVAAIGASDSDGGVNPSGPRETAYRVDLRELELKAAREQAEADRARRELVEAQLAAVRRPSQPRDADAEEPKQ